MSAKQSVEWRSTVEKKHCWKRQCWKGRNLQSLWSKRLSAQSFCNSIIITTLHTHFMQGLLYTKIQKSILHIFICRKTWWEPLKQIMVIRAIFCCCFRISWSWRIQFKSTFSLMPVCLFDLYCLTLFLKVLSNQALV